MVWTLTTTKPSDDGRPSKKTHYLLADSLTQAIRQSASLIVPHLQFTITNVL